MAEDDDDLNDFKLPPHSNEDADAQLDAKALKLVEEYVASLTRSKNENNIRGDIRDGIVKLGINSLSFQHELTAQRMMDAEDRRDYMAGRRRMGRVLADKQGTLFAEDLERIKKRKAKAKEKAAKAAAAAGKDTPEQQERRLAADNNPRSDPKRGGAGKAKNKPASAIDAAEAASARRAKLQSLQADSGAKATMQGAAAQSDAALAESIAAVSAQEQRDGAALLDTAGKPKAQSTIAQEKLAEAKLA